MNISNMSLPPSISSLSQLGGAKLTDTQATPKALETALAVEQQKLDVALTEEKKKNDEEVQEKFNEFVGQTLFGQLLKSMRKTVGKPAYFHGGQAEEIFQQQLDQVLGEKLAETSGPKFSEPMFELFQLGRK